MFKQLPDAFELSVLTKARTLETRVLPLPKLGQDEILLRKEACNICTTDYGQRHRRGHDGYAQSAGRQNIRRSGNRFRNPGEEARVREEVGI